MSLIPRWRSCVIFCWNTNGINRKILFQWNNEEIEFVKNNYNKYNASELARKLTETFNRRFARQTVRNLLVRLNLSYLKANNLTIWNEVPIGTITPRKDNDRTRYLIKVSSSGNWKKDWVECGRYFYTQYYGEIPKDHYIFFKDHDASNWSKDNLIAVPKKVACAIKNLGAAHRINLFQTQEFEALVEIYKTEYMIKEMEGE